MPGSISHVRMLLRFCAVKNIIGFAGIVPMKSKPTSKGGPPINDVGFGGGFGGFAETLGQTSGEGGSF